MRDFPNDPISTDEPREIWTTPKELSGLIRESAARLGGALFGCGLFTLLAWLTADAVVWLSTLAGVLAVLLGVCVLWHLVFLVRAALRFADDLDDQARYRPATPRTTSPIEEH